MVSLRGTKKFSGVVYYLTERETSKTAAKMEAKRLRKAGYWARITLASSKGLNATGRMALKAIGDYSVWARKK